MTNKLFWVLLSLAVSGCDAFFPEPEERVTRIDIYGDRIAYRTRVYETTSALAIGLKAVNDPPRLVELHDCARMDVFEDVVDLIRESGEYDFTAALPEDC